MYSELGKLRVSYRSIFIILLFFLSSIVFFIFFQTTNYKLQFSTILLLILNIYLIYLTWNVPFMLLFSIFIFNYSYIFTIPAFYPNTRFSGIGIYYTEDLIQSVLNQYLLGMSVLILFFKLNKSFFEKNRYLSDSLSLFERKKENVLILYISYFGILFFLFFVNAGKQHNAPITITFEYIYVFLFLIKIYGPNNFLNKLMIHIIVLAIICKTLIYSGRIEIIEALAILFIFYYEKKIKPLFILIISLVFNVLLEAISIHRNIAGDINWNTSKLFFDRSNPPSLILGNEGDVVYSSMAMVGLINQNVVEFSERIRSFTHMLITQLMPIGQFHLFEDANVARYIQKFTVTLGGGLIYTQGYFWLGTTGVIIVSILIAYVIKKAYNQMTSNIFTVTAIYSLTLFPRWFAYFFDFLIKIPLILAFILLLFNIFFSRLGISVKADDKIPNIAGIKFPTYNRTIVSTRGAMVHDYERGIFYDQRDV
ncbi:hypothetical protein NYE66_15655 [Geobacillus sp. FSL W8-0466]|uniref:hypothetical protein n=1 Tax=Geobacillus sp. FSL W8-0466 TaxID=2975350 RepID=UPI0030DCF28F